MADREVSRPRVVVYDSESFRGTQRNRVNDTGLVACSFAVEIEAARRRKPRTSDARVFLKLPGLRVGDAFGLLSGWKAFRGTYRTTAGPRRARRRVECRRLRVSTAKVDRERERERVVGTKAGKLARGRKRGRTGRVAEAERDESKFK